MFTSSSNLTKMDRDDDSDNGTNTPFPDSDADNDIADAETVSIISDDACDHTYPKCLN